MTHDAYVSPFSARYASKEMQALFSDDHKFTTWRKLWVILADAERELGLNITQAQVDELRAHTRDIDYDKAAEYENKLRHDVMAHVHTYGDACPGARGVIHLGATSCYVGDNADILILRDAMQLILSKLVGVARALTEFANANIAQPTLAFTHLQPAQPTTVGKRAALWLNDILFDIDEIDFFLSRLTPLGCKGTTGTQASFLELFNGDEAKVRALDDMIANKLGFEKSVAVSGQTYSRKTDARALSCLSQIAQSAHKFSNDIRLLAHMKEIEEPFEARQIGSSAMAYKRNPMRSERIAALSRFVVINALNGAQTACEQWFERTLDDSANRRLSIAEGFLACDGILNLYLNVASGLITYPKQMEKHLMAEMPFMATENLMMRAAEKGGDRQELHERIRVHSLAAAAHIKQEGGECDLIKRLASDEAFGVSEEELTSALNPADYVGLAVSQTRAFLDNQVAEVLSKYAHIGAQTAQISV